MKPYCLIYSTVWIVDGDNDITIHRVIHEIMLAHACRTSKSSKLQEL